MTTVRTGRPRTPTEQQAHLELLVDDARATLDRQQAKHDADPSPSREDKVAKARRHLADCEADLNDYDGGA